MKFLITRDVHYETEIDVENSHEATDVAKTYDWEHGDNVSSEEAIVITAENASNIAVAIPASEELLEQDAVESLELDATGDNEPYAGEVPELNE